MEYNARRAWIHANVKVVTKKRPRTTVKGVYERNNSRFFKVSTEANEEIVVCRCFFLSTLGYSSDKVITVALGSVKPGKLVPQSDQRGKHPPVHKMSEEHWPVIQKHINSFHPAASHYRREHAPLRKYLQPELSIKEMYADFAQRHPQIPACYETYRKVVRDMNISFVKLGEEFEDCLVYEKHEHDDGENCNTCREWADHVGRARNTRAAYQADRDRQHDPNISGRNAEDVMSAYSKVIRDVQNRDSEHFNFWTDNCTAQNKNWTLFTGMIEKAMRKSKNLYDFSDFQSVINSKGTAIKMEANDFRQWENGVSSAKFTNKPNLSTQSQDDADFKSGEFLKKKVAS
ncbi:hypothetical protein HOLleu_02356 [Holothuria leucospilota]|uniref:Uncharacterized protein n=1 Tax=Holothuria leucospilota TaxID=206669 RepID=A0A9Q1CRJ1_HOLLE|nr:hypothetical protein HOLleu_02356 [Holothuria leucospilota]